MLSTLCLDVNKGVAVAVGVNKVLKAEREFDVILDKRRCGFVLCLVGYNCSCHAVLVTVNADMKGNVYKRCLCRRGKLVVEAEVNPTAVACTEATHIKRYVCLEYRSVALLIARSVDVEKVSVVYWRVEHECAVLNLELHVL